MRVALFGAVGPFTGAVSRALSGVVELPTCVVYTEVPRWLFSIAVREVAGIDCPVWEVIDPSAPKLLRKLHKLQLDWIVVAGFPKLLPAQALRGVAKYGVVNVHPALLPNDRGPTPLFWSLLRGDTETGVTIHELSEGFDEGAILEHVRWPMPFGGRGQEWFADAGKRAGTVLGKRLPEWATKPHLATPQSEPTTPWARKPKHADFEIRPDEWTAARLFHFARGARFFGVPWARLADDVYYFNEALSWEKDGKIPGEFVVLADELLLQLRDGYVRFQLRLLP